MLPFREGRTSEAVANGPGGRHFAPVLEPDGWKRGIGWDTEAIERLSLALREMPTQDRATLLMAAGDTYRGMPYTEAAKVLEECGFEPLFSVYEEYDTLSFFGNPDDGNIAIINFAKEQVLSLDITRLVISNDCFGERPDFEGEPWAEGFKLRRALQTPLGVGWRDALRSRDKFSRIYWSYALQTPEERRAYPWDSPEMAMCVTRRRSMLPGHWRGWMDAA